MVLTDGRLTCLLTNSFWLYVCTQQQVLLFLPHPSLNSNFFAMCLLVLLPMEVTSMQANKCGGISVNFKPKHYSAAKYLLHITKLW